MIGPAAYDVASLLQDARVDVPEALEMALLSRYARARLRATSVSTPAAFTRLYATLAAQRATKILGIFARLDRRDGKPQYLASYAAPIDLFAAIAGASGAGAAQGLVRKPTCRRSGWVYDGANRRCGRGRGRR